MSHALFQIDAFADGPFTGNPAAVVILPAAAEPGWMQHVAAEMNLAETAFLVPRSGAGDAYDLRWFTPTVEVDLCGHATLASAHALWQSGTLTADVASFHTKSGVLTAARDAGWIELNFPATHVVPNDPPAGLIEALGVGGSDVLFIGRSRFDYLVEVASEELVRILTPEFGALRTLPVRGTIVTSRATTPAWHFVSRFFAPASGIDEDPVTGSSHCALTPYWAERLGRNEFTARQLSARGGTLQLRLDGERVRLRGQAVTIFRGELTA
jgi:PhzF family phenazine biosynthesis protein